MNAEEFHQIISICSLASVLLVVGCFCLVAGACLSACALRLYVMTDECIPL